MNDMKKDAKVEGTKVPDSMERDFEALMKMFFERRIMMLGEHLCKGEEYTEVVARYTKLYDALWDGMDETLHPSLRDFDTVVGEIYSMYEDYFYRKGFMDCLMLGQAFVGAGKGVDFAEVLGRV